MFIFYNYFFLFLDFYLPDFMYSLFPLISGANDYDLIHYWNSTGVKGEEINSLYEKTVDDQLTLLYLKERENGRQPINAVRMVRKKRYIGKTDRQVIICCALTKGNSKDVINTVCTNLGDLWSQNPNF